MCIQTTGRCATASPCAGIVHAFFSSTYSCTYKQCENTVLCHVHAALVVYQSTYYTYQTYHDWTNSRHTTFARPTMIRQIQQETHCSPSCTLCVQECADCESVLWSCWKLPVVKNFVTERCFHGDELRRPYRLSKAVVVTPFLQLCQHCGYM